MADKHVKKDSTIVPFSFSSDSSSVFRNSMNSSLLFSWSSKAIALSKSKPDIVSEIPSAIFRRFIPVVLTNWDTKWACEPENSTIETNVVYI